MRSEWIEPVEDVHEEASLTTDRGHETKNTKGSDTEDPHDDGDESMTCHRVESSDTTGGPDITTNIVLLLRCCGLVTIAVVHYKTHVRDRSQIMHLLSMPYFKVKNFFICMAIVWCNIE